MKSTKAMSEAGKASGSTATAARFARPGVPFGNDGHPLDTSPPRATVFAHEGADYLVISVPIESHDEGLTQVERALLPLVRRGLSNKDIAALRGVSHRTVANQISRLRQKLSARSRRALAP